MIFKISRYLKDCKQYYLEAPSCIYAIQFVQSCVEDDDIKALYMWLRRRVIDGFSFLLCDSTTDSNTCKKEILITHNRGRPKTVVIGKKVNRHIHGLIVIESESIDYQLLNNELHKYFNKRRKRKPYLKQQKIGKCSEGGLFIVKYDFKQADHIYKGGNFDFDYFTKDTYSDYF